MKKSLIFLFILRLFFYLSVTTLILLHPGISISFDRIGILQWLVIIPLQALIAFLPMPMRRRCIIAAASLLPLAIVAGGFGLGALPPLFAGLISFTLSFLLFHYPRWAKPAVLEPFLLAWVCLRLLALSRSGEDIAGQSMALTQFILVWTGAIFLLHSVVVYFCLYPKSTGGAGKEGTLFLCGAAAALLVVLVALPPDFVSNTIIENLHPERIPKAISDDDTDKGIPENSGGRRRDGRRTLPRDERGGRNGERRRQELRGLSEHEWQSRGGRSRGRRGGSSEDGGGGLGEDEENRQYLVMIVASDGEPVYMGDSFRGQLDPVEGFLVSPEEPLNRLANQRFFVTWFNNEFDSDIGRARQEVFSLSTLSQKYLPYRPVSVDPTILNEDSGPLRYIHQVVSNTHFENPLLLVRNPTRHLNSYERSVLARYLELPLERSDRELFDAYLDKALAEWRSNRDAIIRRDRSLSRIFYFESDETESTNEYLETIIALLVSFSRYQYNLNPDDDYSIDALKHFLFDSAEGDCVEFSNSLALLGRLAGIPSRVVTGYLASESAQTPVHLRGIASLRARIPVLQQFPFESLFMVTNTDSHSWTQFYIPDYGWLDFEATSFAIPPVGMGDVNNWDVVIPLIDKERVFSKMKKFPWRAVLRTAGVMALFALACAYMLRYGREAALYFGARRGTRDGARALYLLLLSRLAADGKPIKPASKTALEYSDLFGGAGESPHFREFAAVYTELRWREFNDPAESASRFLLLKQAYRNILKTTRRRGILKALIRVFSLRGLAYL